MTNIADLKITQPSEDARKEYEMTEMNIKSSVKEELTPYEKEVSDYF